MINTEIGNARITQEINRRFEKPLAQTSGSKKALTLKTGKGTQANYYIIQEDITQGERIRAYRVEARLNGKWSAIARGPGSQNHS